MKVTQINGYHLAMTPEVPLGNARTFLRQRHFLALEVRTDAGIVGWGEVFSSPWAAAALLRRQVGAQVLGRSPFDHGALQAQLLPQIGYDKRGPSMMALSALDMALHDIAARAHGMSVAQYLGGAVRDALPCYASGPFIREGDDPYAHYEADIERYLSQGFRAVKPRCGVSPRQDGAMAAHVRALLGEGLDFMLDINQGYGAAAARQAASLMEPARPLWIEEPVHPEDLDGYGAVARSTHTPLAGGEALGSLAAFHQFLACGGVSVLQPDLTVCGGYTGYRKVAALAQARDICVMPHAFGTAINFYASLQMAAATPTYPGGTASPYPWIEFDPTGNPLIELFGTPIDSRGRVGLPDTPGTGIELTPERLAPWITEHWSLALT